MPLGTTLTVNEIYASLQGESSYQGLPCTFVRLTGCDLRCGYCDTEYAFHVGRKMDLPQILASVRELGISLVEVTGGEPLLQEGVYPLMEVLCDEGYEVLIETSGAHDISQIDPRVTVIMDLKTPSSGESSRNLWSNINHLKKGDEIKFVIGDRGDFEWSLKVIREKELHQKAKILFSPVWKRMGIRTLADWAKTSGLPIRVQIQLHKHIWGLTAST